MPAVYTIAGMTSACFVDGRYLSPHQCRPTATSKTSIHTDRPGDDTMTDKLGTAGKAMAEVYATYVFVS